MRIHILHKKKDLNFSLALHSSDVILPDGESLCIASKFLTGKKVRKIAGFELFQTVVSLLNHRGGKVYFLGSDEETLSEIKTRMANDYPNLDVNTLSPPFSSEYTKIEISKFVQDINRCAPDVIFVGLTAPKQEKLIHAIRDKTSCDLICGIGAVFDFYSGRRKRAPSIFIKYKLEWLYRFYQDPRHLWKRNLVSTPLFAFELLATKLKRASS